MKSNIHDKNFYLENYEYKHPDYDYLEREYDELYQKTFEPTRFKKNKKSWKQQHSKPDIWYKMKKIPAKLMFVGDLSCFDRQIEEATTENGFDFKYEFERIRPLFRQADLVVGNLETPIVHHAPFRTERYVSEQNYYCNAPIAFLEAVKYSGIDMVTTSNNHDLDTGAVGIGETIDIIDRFGLIQTGTFKTDKKHYEMVSVNGYHIAIAAFTTTHNNKFHNLTDEGKSFLLSDYSKENAKAVIDDARANGAEVVIASMHWGKEHMTTEDSEQKMIANNLAEMGYDCIIGSHPHVLQPYDEIKLGNRRVPVFYSLGNFVHHMADSPKARSAAACLELSRENGSILVKASYIPLIISKKFGDKKYVVLPLRRNPEDSNNKRKLNRIKRIIGSKVKISRSYEYGEYFENEVETPSRTIREKVNPEEITEWPYLYDDGKYRYSVNNAEAEILELSSEYEPLSGVIPKTVLDRPIYKLPEGLFKDSKTLRKLNFTSYNEVVSKQICKGCQVLEGFQLRENTKVIAEEAFADCPKLYSVFLKNSVERIGSKAFANCNELRSLKIACENIRIANDAFSNCPKLVFYCEAGSEGEKFAKEHGFKIVNMKIENE